MLNDLILSESFFSLVFSPPRTSVRKLIVKGEVKYQLTEEKGSQAFHRNLSPSEFAKWFQTACESEFKQAQIFTSDNDFHLLFGKKGMKVIKKPPTKSEASPHNRAKKFLISENEPYLPSTHKKEKFLQVQKFLEIVKDTLGPFKEGDPITVVDFGCGKAYLTFALYHFLSQRYLVKMIGIDLKKTVIEDAEKKARELGYEGLSFQVGSIDSTSLPPNVDIMVALHACDTATDAALEKALKLNAKVILAAPCCQHELYNQLENPDLASLLRHGILRERLASLVTDAARADLLSQKGYKVQLLEFIDAEHTPKNILIRAVKSIASPEAEARYQKLKKAFGITPDLERRLL